MVISGFGSTNGSSPGERTHGAQTDLATIGGSGNNAKQRPFQRINDLLMRPDCDETNVTCTIERTKTGGAGSSVDEIPLNSITVRTDLEWNDRGSIAVGDREAGF